jgi:hypothetical protein
MDVHGGGEGDSKGVTDDVYAKMPPFRARLRLAPSRSVDHQPYSLGRTVVERAMNLDHDDVRDHDVRHTL